MTPTIHTTLVSLPPEVADMNFEDRLQRAIERGERQKSSRGQEALQRQLSQAELRSLHAQHRIDLSDHIDTCLRKLADHLPGFKFQSVMGEEGWGARITRDDLHLAAGRAPESRYSRLEFTITPFGSGEILEVVAKGTVRNREILHRKHYQKLAEFDVEAMKELIDLRVLEFAEQYTAAG